MKEKKYDYQIFGTITQHFNIGTHVYTISKVIGINEKKENYLPNKEYLSDPESQRTYMTAKCKIFVTAN